MTMIRMIVSRGRHQSLFSCLKVAYHTLQQNALWWYLYFSLVLNVRCFIKSNQLLIKTINCTYQEEIENFNRVKHEKWVAKSNKRRRKLKDVHETVP